MDYYRQWQAELSVSYVAAKASGFDADGVADVEAVQERMTQVWWHVGEMKPAYLCYLAHAALPENSAQFPLWREIAAEVLPQLDETQRALLVSGRGLRPARCLPAHRTAGPLVRAHRPGPPRQRVGGHAAVRGHMSQPPTSSARSRSRCLQRRSWHAYSKRLAKIAVGVSRWVRRLQEYALQPTEGLVTNANSSLEVRPLPGSVAVQPLLLSSAHAKQRARTCACTQHVALAFAAAQLTAATATLCRSCWRSPATLRALCRRNMLPREPARRWCPGPASVHSARCASYR